MSSSLDGDDMFDILSDARQDEIYKKEIGGDKGKTIEKQNKTVLVKARIQTWGIKIKCLGLLPIGQPSTELCLFFRILYKIDIYSL